MERHGMIRPWLRVLLGVALLIANPVGTIERTVFGQQEDAASPRAHAPLTILQLNDVYTTVPIDGRGGLARIATIRQRLAAEGRAPFVMLAGDFISPSVPSSIFKGEQMIAALNAAGVDMATLGNHEFDFSIDVLLERMAQARWQWVISNVVDTNTGDDGRTGGQPGARRQDRGTTV